MFVPFKFTKILNQYESAGGHRGQLPPVSEECYDFTYTCPLCGKTYDGGEGGDCLQYEDYVDKPMLWCWGCNNGDTTKYAILDIKAPNPSNIVEYVRANYTPTKDGTFHVPLLYIVGIKNTEMSDYGAKKPISEETFKQFVDCGYDLSSTLAKENLIGRFSNDKFTMVGANNELETADVGWGDIDHEYVKNVPFISIEPTQVVTEEGFGYELQHDGCPVYFKCADGEIVEMTGD